MSRNYKENNKLRFVIRDGKKILQQYWDDTPTVELGWASLPLGKSVGEWRDVPMVILAEEEKNT